MSSKSLKHQWHGHGKAVNRVVYLLNASLAVSRPFCTWHVKCFLTIHSLGTTAIGLPTAMCFAAVPEICQANSVLSALQVSGSRDTAVRLWNRSATEAVAVLSGHSLPVTGLAPLDHHNQICSGSRDCTLRLWDAAASAQVACTKTSQNLVTFMAAVPAEPAVLQTGEDLCLRLWDMRTMQAVQMLSQHDNIPLCCDVSSDGE